MVGEEFLGVGVPRSLPLGGWSSCSSSNVLYISIPPPLLGFSSSALASDLLLAHFPLSWNTLGIREVDRGNIENQ